MPKGGFRKGAGRRPIGGDSRRLLDEAHGILRSLEVSIAQLAMRGELDAARIEGAGIETARTGMRASRRLLKAARLLSSQTASSLG